jgi:hypothetical protein
VLILKKISAQLLSYPQSFNEHIKEKELGSTEQTPGGIAHNLNVRIL